MNVILNEQIFLLASCVLAGLFFGLVYIAARLIRDIRDPRNIPDGPPGGIAAWKARRKTLNRAGS